ncbi:MAG: hypothetical protein ACLTPG_02810 [Mediterraneibacter gnavus]
MTEMKEQYLDGATKELISGYLRASVGEPAMLTVWTERYKRDRLFRTGCAGGTESADGGVQNPKATF